MTSTVCIASKSARPNQSAAMQLQPGEPSRMSFVVIARTYGSFGENQSAMQPIHGTLQ